MMKDAFTTNHEFLKPIEAAELLRMSIQTLWRLLRENAIPHIRITARNILIRRSDLDAWLNAHAR
jgi:excisionase family DNA binding protein